MREDKQMDIIIDLLTDFDEMSFIPTTTVPGDPEAYAIKWRAEITKALKGYRKQIEGEWLVDKNLFGSRVACSCCGYKENRGPAWDISWGMYKFCPNCGAKMKGGGEG